MDAYHITGGNGGRFASSASGSVSCSAGFSVITDTVLASLSSSNYSNTSLIVGQTLTAGTYIGGRHTITITSGIVQCHDL